MFSVLVPSVRWTLAPHACLRANQKSVVSKQRRKRIRVAYSHQVKKTFTATVWLPLHLCVAVPIRHYYFSIDQARRGRDLVVLAWDDARPPAVSEQYIVDAGMSTVRSGGYHGHRRCGGGDQTFNEIRIRFPPGR
jgi:hypothetical protein